MSAQHSLAMWLLLLASAGFCSGQHVGGLRSIIVGGVDSSIDSYPYQASLRLRGQHICGASIISADWALTAAHCCEGQSASSLSLRVGSTRLSRGGVLHVVKDVVMHPQYDSVTVDFDMCALKTLIPFRFTTGVRPIVLASPGTTYRDGTLAVITGWGRTQDSSLAKASEILQKVVIPITSNEACARSYDAVGLGGNVGARQLCAVAPNGGKDSCQGDSGGPMAVAYRLAGVTSWGIGCADKRYPGVYARVSALRGWIQDTTGV